MLLLLKRALRTLILLALVATVSLAQGFARGQVGDPPMARESLILVDEPASNSTSAEREEVVAGSAASEEEPSRVNMSTVGAVARDCDEGGSEAKLGMLERSFVQSHCGGNP